MSDKHRVSKCRKLLNHNRFFTILAGVYVTTVLLFSTISCIAFYHQRRAALLSQTDLTFKLFKQKYNDTLDTFWELYMPIYDSRNSTHAILESYFAPSDNGISSQPLERYTLTYAMQQILQRNNEVQWIALYSENRDTNYILFHTSTAPEPLSEDFPYLEKLKDNTGSLMQIYGMEPISNGSNVLNTFAICGGIPSNMGKGKIIAGYSVAPYEQLFKNTETNLHSLTYLMTSEQDIIFHSGANYNEATVTLPSENYVGKYRAEDGRLFYLHSEISGNRSSVISYQLLWKDVFLYAHHYTPYIVLITLAFSTLSIIIYALLLKQINKEVNIIRTGLDLIGDNHLEHRLPLSFQQNGLPEIAASINQMSQRLQHHINRTYYYELRQKEAELSELQAKFNPHFLYNSLEMLRSRCYQNHDAKTAALIAQLAGIFRGFISSDSFIPLTEELAFSKKYIALFSARYQDQVQIHYDFETELLKYGVIRNIFQPLIENYFVHGFEAAAKEDNYILFSGKSLDEHTMMLCAEDNGSGMSDEEIDRLNATLQEPIKISTDSYGLKNLHQRLRLFYGKDCGLCIIRNGEKGFCVQMTLLKLTVDAYKAEQQSRENL